MAQAAHPAVRKMSERGPGRREEMLSMQTQASRKENESDGSEECHCAAYG